MSWLLRAALFSSVVSFCNGQSAQPKDGLNKLKYVQDVATVDCQNYIPNFTADMKKMFETGVNEKGQPSPFPKEVGLSYLAIAKKIKDKCCDVKTDGRVSTLTKCTDAEIEKIVNEEPTVEIGNPESVKDDTPAKQTCSKIVPILLAAVGMFA